MRVFFTISILVFLIACGPDQSREDYWLELYAKSHSSARQLSSSSVEPSSSSVARSSSSGCTAIDNTTTQFCLSEEMKNYTDYANYGYIEYEGQIYRTVQIGNQTWMAENLNYNANGSACYDNYPANCDKYGRLYDWATAMGLPTSCNSTSCASQVQAKHQGICPEGWHIPSDSDWSALMTAVGGVSASGRHLKAQSGWYDCGPSGSGSSNVCSDTYGFSALPGGNGFGTSFFKADYIGDWWGSSENNGNIAYYRYMYYNYESAGWINGNKTYLFSVRCLQDSSQDAPSSSSIVPSSSSVALSSSSSEVLSSSSEALESSSSVTESSSSVVPPPSSSSGGLCSDFVEGSEREHYGKLKKQFCDERDGTKYVYVTIGTDETAQTWMAENLNYYAEGSKCYENEPENRIKYGRLYNWNTAMASCPDGWHIPDDKEWNALMTAVGGSSKAGRHLKAQTGWTSCGPSGNAYVCSDTYGFSALPGGYGEGTSFGNVGNAGSWWSSIERGDGAHLWFMRNNYEFISPPSGGYNSKTSLFSVRCVLD